MATFFYRAWAERHEETSAKQIQGVGLTACHAAERYVEENLADLDYPSQVNIFVREEGSPVKDLFDVEVIPVPQAYATRIKRPRPVLSQMNDGAS